MDRKKVLSWAMYDWANSAFSVTVMAGFFPVFFKHFWSAGTDAIVTTARLGVVISVSSFLIAMMSPTLGVIADLKGYRKKFCFLFMFLGVLATASLSFIPMGDWLMAALAYGVAMMAINASCVFYDALLPVVAKGRDMDYASSLGYSLGYLGGGLLFAVNVVMYLKPAFFGFTSGTAAVQASFLTVAVWWLVFSLPLARNVPEPSVTSAQEGVLELTFASINKLYATLKLLSRDRNLLFFLIAYWIYIDGVYTVMTMAVDYGISLGLEAGDLMTALLITQFIGFPCTFLFGILAKHWGCRLPILFCIAIYGLTVVFSIFMSTAWHFYALAAIIGLVQGGVQSLSRSVYARMTPESASGEYFGLFNLIGKFASVMGPLFVALGVTLTGNSRMGISSLLVLFVIGGTLLFLVKEPLSQKE